MHLDPALTRSSSKLKRSVEAGAATQGTSLIYGTAAVIGEGQEQGGIAAHLSRHWEGLRCDAVGLGFSPVPTSAPPCASAARAHLAGAQISQQQRLGGACDEEALTVDGHAA